MTAQDGQQIPSGHLKQISDHEALVNGRIGFKGTLTNVQSEKLLWSASHGSM